ncbi:MAG: hypothetical protein WBI88_05830 [Caldicoprobacterales bacterium]
MYQVQLSKERVRNHIQYDWWKYLAGILVTIFLWNIVTTITRPRTPADKKIEIFLVGDYVLDEFMETLTNDIMEDFPNLLEVNLSHIPLGEDIEMDYVGRQKLMVMLGSQTGDLYAFSKEEFERIAEQGAFIPLDDFINENMDLIDHDKLEMHKATYFDGENEIIEEYYYGIPMEGLKLFEDSGYDVSDKIIGVMAFSKNQDNAFKVLKWILNDGELVN